MSSAPLFMLGLAVGTGLGLFLARAVLARGDTAALERTLAAQSEQLQTLTRVVTRLGERQGTTVCPAAAALDRAALRAELASSLEEVLHTPEQRPAAPTHEQAPPLPPEALLTLSTGHELVAGAIARRSWGDEEAEQLRHVMARLPPQAHEELVLRVVSAINRGQLRVETQGLPF